MKVLICAVCGYQWNVEEQEAQRLFELFCPICDANLVHEYSPQKQHVMDDNYDGLPWF